MGKLRRMAAWLSVVPPGIKRYRKFEIDAFLCVKNGSHEFDFYKIFGPLSVLIRRTDLVHII